MNKRTKNLIIALFFATLITLLCVLKVFRSPELWLEDKLYQRPAYTESPIVIIGIDDEDIKNFGPYNSWDRSIMAGVLEKLASDPDNLPAVVAVDTMYSGKLSPESDARLVKAAEKLGMDSVVLMGRANYLCRETCEHYLGGMPSDHPLRPEYLNPKHIFQGTFVIEFYECMHIKASRFKNFPEESNMTRQPR